MKFFWNNSFNIVNHGGLKLFSRKHKQTSVTNITVFIFQNTPCTKGYNWATLNMNMYKFLFQCDFLQEQLWNKLAVIVCRGNVQAIFLVIRNLFQHKENKWTQPPVLPKATTGLSWWNSTVLTSSGEQNEVINIVCVYL